MKTFLPAALLASLAIAQPAISQPVPKEVLPVERQCSLANLFEDSGGSSRAKYAAVVGIMSQDPAVHSALLANRSAQMCAHAVSQSFCSKQVFKHTLNWVTTAIPSSKLMDALGAIATAKAPEENPRAATLGTLGAIAGGVMGVANSGSPLEGFVDGVKGAATIGGLGLGAGALLDSGKDLGACKELQSDFTDITAAMMRGGLRRQADAEAMIATVQRVAAREGSPKQKETMGAMVEVMEATAYRIEKARNR
ncbi:hypothetical protein HNP73_002766 [Amaricoccus macauensis]|uniref:Uncharacterized protein n=1 Tax=Amaricoccus macauensis TaxID=57001 RepID=A0A840SQ07_9RHOB|nr:hypothetical protein [Amaricoccus macauensis]MBB5222830.1 hypothetical protein [Amaricoccus macauensis]